MSEQQGPEDDGFSRKITYALVGLFGGGAMGALAGVIVSAGMVIVSAGALVGVTFFVCG